MRELRSLTASELRAASSSERRLTGYAAVFNEETQIADFREVVRPGAFKRTIREGADVRALIDHNSSLILGRTKSGTLKLSEDSRGLRFDVNLPNTTIANDVLESVRRGDVSQCSFGFIVQKENWKSGKPRLRELLDLDLLDVSVVTYPAYEGTSVEARHNPSGYERCGLYRGFSAPVIQSPEVEDPMEVERLRLRIAIAKLV